VHTNFLFLSKVLSENKSKIVILIKIQRSRNQKGKSTAIINKQQQLQNQHIGKKNNNQQQAQLSTLKNIFNKPFWSDFDWNW